MPDLLARRESVQGLVDTFWLASFGRNDDPRVPMERASRDQYVLGCPSLGVRWFVVDAIARAHEVEKGDPVPRRIYPEKEFIPSEVRVLAMPSVQQAPVVGGVRYRITMPINLIDLCPATPPLDRPDVEMRVGADMIVRIVETFDPVTRQRGSDLVIQLIPIIDPSEWDLFWCGANTGLLYGLIAGLFVLTWARTAAGAGLTALSKIFYALAGVATVGIPIAAGIYAVSETPGRIASFSDVEDLKDVLEKVEVIFRCMDPTLFPSDITIEDVSDPSVGSLQGARLRFKNFERWILTAPLIGLTWSGDDCIAALGQPPPPAEVPDDLRALISRLNPDPAAAGAGLDASLEYTSDQGYAAIRLAGSLPGARSEMFGELREIQGRPALAGWVGGDCSLVRDFDERVNRLTNGETDPGPQVPLLLAFYFTNPYLACKVLNVQVTALQRSEGRRPSYRVTDVTAMMSAFFGGAQLIHHTAGVVRTIGSWSQFSTELQNGLQLTDGIKILYRIPPSAFAFPRSPLSWLRSVSAVRATITTSIGIASSEIAVPMDVVEGVMVLLGPIAVNPDAQQNLDPRAQQNLRAQLFRACELRDAFRQVGTVASGGRRGGNPLELLRSEAIDPAINPATEGGPAFFSEGVVFYGPRGWAARAELQQDLEEYGGFRTVTETLLSRPEESPAALINLRLRNDS